MKIGITRKSSGSYFIGYPSNNKQELVFESARPKELAAFILTIQYSKIIKAEYSKSTTYYRVAELTEAFFKSLRSAKKEAAYERAVEAVGYKVRRRSSAILSRLRSIATTRAFTPEVKQKFVDKWKEIGGKDWISNKEANSLVWKNQRYFDICSVDICVARSLVKKAINNN